MDVFHKIGKATGKNPLLRLLSYLLGAGSAGVVVYGVGHGIGSVIVMAMQ